MELFKRWFGRPEGPEPDKETKPQADPIPEQVNTPLPNDEEQTLPGVQSAAPSDQDSITTTETPKVDNNGSTDKLAPDDSPAARNTDSSTETPPPSPAYLAVGGPTRPLEPEKVISGSNAQMRFGMTTDVGMVRSNNQDAALSFYVASRSANDRPDFGLFIVADGMGGHHDGEKASALTAHAVAEHVTSHIFIPLLTNDNSSDRPPITEVLIDAVQHANSRVLADIPDGGTTLSAVTVIDDLAHIVHVGDSRVYLVHKDSIEQISRDHSLVQRLVELGQITPEEATSHEQGNVLYRAIGQNENLEVDTLTRRLPSGTHLLLCSDGLWQHLENEEMRRIVNDWPPQEACDKLVALANTRGGTDNITAVVLHIPRG